MNARTDRRLDAIERRHRATAGGCDAAEMMERAYTRFETAVNVAGHGIYDASHPARCGGAYVVTYWRDPSAFTMLPPAEMTLEEAAEIAAPFGGLRVLELYGQRYRRGEYRETRDRADIDAGAFARALAAAARQEGYLALAADLESSAVERDGLRLADVQVPEGTDER